MDASEAGNVAMLEVLLFDRAMIEVLRSSSENVCASFVKYVSVVRSEGKELDWVCTIN